jgi:hypothetical protein
VVATAELDAEAVLEIEPGDAVRLNSRGSDGVRVLLSPDVVAFSVADAETIGTIAARSDNRGGLLPAGDVVYVVNTGRQTRTARAYAGISPTAATVSSSGSAETLLAAHGTVVFSVEPGAADASLAVWAEDPSEVVLLTNSGRLLRARPPGGEQPHWSLPAVRGELRVTAQAGPVAAWITGSGQDTVEWAQRGSPRPIELIAGENEMRDGPQRWEFSLYEEMFVVLSTDNRGLTALLSGEDEVNPQITIGAGENRRALAVLGAGSHSAVTRPLAGEPQPEPLRFQALSPIPISENTDAVPLFLNAGERAVFEVTIPGDAESPDDADNEGSGAAAGSAVGVGLLTETDEFTSYLLDDQLGIVGTGRIYYRALSPGRYFFLVENGSRPMNVVPVIYADQGSRTGVPDDVIESYRGE